MHFGFFVLRTDLFDFFYHGNGHCLFTGLACSKILTCLLFHLKIGKNVYLSQHLKSPALVEMWQFGGTLSNVLLLKAEVGGGEKLYHS